MCVRENYHLDYLIGFKNIIGFCKSIKGECFADKQRDNSENLGIDNEFLNPLKERNIFIQCIKIIRI